MDIQVVYKAKLINQIELGIFSYANVQIVYIEVSTNSIQDESPSVIIHGISVIDETTQVDDEDLKPKVNQENPKPKIKHNQVIGIPYQHPNHMSHRNN
jgi:hypothetical protein